MKVKIITVISVLLAFGILTANVFAAELGTLYCPTDHTYYFTIVDAAAVDTSEIKNWTALSTVYLGFYGRCDDGNDSIWYNIIWDGSFDKSRWFLIDSSGTKVDSSVYIDTCSVIAPYNRIRAAGGTNTDASTGNVITIRYLAK